MLNLYYFFNKKEKKNDIKKMVKHSVAIFSASNVIAPWKQVVMRAGTWGIKD